ncbi:MAG: GIY-YIG nuclease family protein [Alphaproteobacteria bacterium]
MYYVYILASEPSPGRFYVGLTADLDQRLKEHNSGKSSHTAKYEPWKLAIYIAFADRRKAFRFERYLKSGSGRAFAKRQF